MGWDGIGLDWIGSPGGRGYRAPYGANKRDADQRKAKEVAEEKIANEALKRIGALPQVVRTHILHFLEIKMLEGMKLPGHVLRAVLQAREPFGTKELVKSTWMHRIETYSDTYPDTQTKKQRKQTNKQTKEALFRLAERADLVPRCKVSTPSIYKHSCPALCPWFAPFGDWNAFYARASFNGSREKERKKNLKQMLVVRQ